MFPEFRSQCPIASSLDLFGDRWTLIVLRSIFVGARRFGELAAASDRIATNILADRLERLERYGLVSRRAYQDAPPRYEYALTEAGADLLPVLQALAAWGGRHIPGRWPAPDWFRNATPADFAPGGGEAAGGSER